MCSDVDNPTETVAGRIESDSKTKLTRAAEECDVTLSAYLESVIEEHIDRNPQNLHALEPSYRPPDGFIEKMLEELE